MAISGSGASSSIASILFFAASDDLMTVPVTARMASAVTLRQTSLNAAEKDAAKLASRCSCAMRYWKGSSVVSTSFDAIERTLRRKPSGSPRRLADARNASMAVLSSRT